MACVLQQRWLFSFYLVACDGLVDPAGKAILAAAMEPQLAAEDVVEDVRRNIRGVIGRVSPSHVRMRATAAGPGVVVY